MPFPSQAKSLDQLLRQMEGRYGSRLVRHEEHLDRKVVPTGSVALDYATRIGGWPIGRLIEIVGVEGTGKTTLLFRTLANLLKMYPERAVGYIDMEHTLDEDWAVANGLNVYDKRFLHFKPDDSEQVSDQMLMMARSGLLSAVAVDSIGSMESGTAFEKEAREYTVGRNAQIITRMLKQLAVLGTRHEVTSFLVNQYRANIGVLKGPSEIPAGPRALKYATSMRVSTKKGPEAPLKVRMDGEEEIVGYNFAARVERSKVSAQGRSAQFWILNQPTEQYGEIGIWTAAEAFALGKKTGVLNGTSWVHLPDGTKHNGEDKTRIYLSEHPEVCDQIRDLAVAKVPADEIKPEVAVTYTPDAE